MTFQNDRFITFCMARPKAYNRQKVIADATQLFWKKGYQATSLSELVSVTGLNKHSMYKEFGSKAKFFDECLDHYRGEIGKELLDILKREPLGLGNIRLFFENRITHICSKDFKCCLMVKSIVEMELIEASAQERIKKQNRMMLEAFRDCLSASVKSGELPKKADPELLANYLLHFLTGMLIAGKPNQGEAEARKLLALVMSVVSA